MTQMTSILKQNHYRLPETMVQSTVGVFQLWGDFGALPPNVNSPCKSYSDFLNIFGYYIEKCELYMTNHEDKFDGQTFSLIIHLKERFKHFNFFTGQVSNSFWITATDEVQLWVNALMTMHEGNVYFTHKNDVEHFFKVYIPQREEQHYKKVEALQNTIHKKGA